MNNSPGRSSNREVMSPTEDFSTTYMDPVHGHIDLPKYLVQIINTK